MDAAKALQMASPLRVKVRSPAPGSNFSQKKKSVFVKGTVSGGGFQEARFSYRSLQSSNWLPLASPSEGLVANWMIEGLPSGVYLLRLVAVSNGGLRYEDVIEVGLDKKHRIINTHSGSKPATDYGTEPRISGNRIVWEEPAGVHVYDLIQNREEFILPGAHKPDISGEYLVASLAHGELVVFDFRTK